MTLNMAPAEGARTGERYRESLQGGREVWLGGDNAGAVFGLFREEGASTTNAVHR